MKKFKDIYDLGVRHFALFLDDIPAKLSKPEDKKRFGKLEKAHSFLTNKVYNSLKRIDKNNYLLFVPTRYHGFKSKEYLKYIGKNLNKRVPICWTGKKIVSPKITDKELKKITRLLKRKIFLWDNYPVNDFKKKKLFLGPVTGRSSNVKKYVRIYCTNPMNQAYASKIPLYTISSWLNNTAKYDKTKAWEQSLKSAFKKYNHNYKNVFSFFTHTRLNNAMRNALNRTIIKFLETKSASKKEKHIKKIRLLLKNYLKALDSILKSKSHIIREIRLWLMKLKLSFRCCLLAIKINKQGKRKHIISEFLKLRKDYKNINKISGTYLLEKLIKALISIPK